MKILIKSAMPEVGIGGGFVATIEGVSGVLHRGNTMGEAVGNLVIARAEQLGLSTEYVRSPKKKVQKS